MFRINYLSSPLFAFLVVASALAQDSGGQQGNSSSSENKAKSPAGDFYVVDSLNEGVPHVSNPPDLSTPLATVENFIFSCREQDFRQAAQSLNFDLIPQDERGKAAEFARKFYYALNQRLWIDIEDLPDRPDGQMPPRVGKENPLAGKPRRSIRLGVINIDDWKQVRVRIQRVKTADAEAVWLFSPQTVEKIPMLYQEFGPSWVEQAIPGWAKTRLAGKVPVWEWIALLIFVLLGDGL